jgi:exopolyphosphatase/guanosine-5'-triphosphate,3'-diphosphate pyrophosphatase
VSDNEIFAALDLGSNSFHLLLARFVSGRMVVLDRHKELVQLAAGLDARRRISAAIVRQALGVLPKFAERLRGIPKSHVRVVGTNTMRVARNADSFLTRAEKLLGVPIDIISGTEEARLIYLGVAKDFTPGFSQRLVVDIGGGSTELVGGGQEPHTLESLYMGCVSFSQRYFGDGKLRRKDYKDAVLAARTEIQTVAPVMLASQWDEVVGSSGTIRCVQKMIERTVGDGLITLPALEFIADRVVAAKSVERLDIPGLTDDRRSTIAGGLAILHAVFLELNIRTMDVSEYTIREGIVHDLAGRVQHHDRRERTIRTMMQQYHADAAQAQRVDATAQALYEQVRNDVPMEPDRARAMLHWAACLHEIGLLVAHNGYHKHGAYIIENGDMAGFSRQEQKLLAFLVVNHRRKLKPQVASYGVDPDWRLMVIFRLACLFNRRRTPHQLPPIGLRLKPGNVEVQLPRNWLEQHPLTREELEKEKELLKARDLKLSYRVL